MRLTWLTVALLVLTWLAWVAVVPLSVAAADSRSDFAYPFSRVWTAAVRLLRVDFGCPIREKDKEDGYFLFDYQRGRDWVPGSVELVRTRVQGVDGVRVVLKVPAMPQYVERMILTRLGRKLGEELGAPVLPAKTDAKQAADDRKEAPAEEQGQSRQKDSTAERDKTKQKQSDKTGQ